MVIIKDDDDGEKCSIARWHCDILMLAEILF